MDPIAISFTCPDFYLPRLNARTYAYTHRHTHAEREREKEKVLEHVYIHTCTRINIQRYG